MKKSVHQFHATVAARDAIGENMFALQEGLRSLGYESEIFGKFFFEEVAGRVRRWEDYARISSPDNVLIVHYSIGFEGLDGLLALPDRKILVYHNITPAEFVEDYSLMFAQACREGLESLLKFRGRVDDVVGDSAFNLQNLHDAGFKGGAVIPILVDFDKLLIPPDPEVLSRYNNNGWVNWLFVGKLFPNKKQDDLIRAFYFYKKYIHSDSRLFLVGHYQQLGIYHEYLRHISVTLGLDGVVIPGMVSQSELAAYYRAADLFVSMSEHEGFCVPLLEAIRAGLPVLAYDSTAVPETLGGTGVLLKEKKFPEIAELANYVLQHGHHKTRLVENQKQRLDDFSRERVMEKWQKLLGRFF